MKNKNFQTIGMVVAMDKEIKPFFSKLGQNVVEKTVGGYSVFECTIKNKKVYLIKSGIGEIYAAAATQVLISVFNCDVIVNFGVCGSINDNISVCETVIVNGVVHYDFDLSDIDDVKVGQYPGYEVVLRPSEELVDLALSINKNVKTAICASADKFVAKKEVKEKLTRDFNADVCDMECAGVLLTSLNCGVPTLIIKAVSDGNGGAEEFNRRVYEASKVYLDTINAILERI